MSRSNSGNNNIFRRIIKILLPPDKWKFPVTILLGIFLGLLIFIFHISNAVSYLSDDPVTCINCHIMTPQFATWEHGSHGRVTNCNDCHVPQDNIINKYLFKTQDGLRHAYVFTFRLEPQVIQIKEAGKKAVQSNCIRCHIDLIYPVSTRAISNRHIMTNMDDYCWRCHRETPHGRVNSLASSPYARVPKLTPAIPEWMIKIFKSENNK